MKDTGLPLALLFAVCVLLVASQVLLKLSLQRASQQASSGMALVWALLALWTFWLAVGSTAGAAAIWVLVLRTAPLSVAYPMISLGYVLMIPVARILFGEAITVPRVAGAVLILIGVTVLGRSLG